MLKKEIKRIIKKTLLKYGYKPEIIYLFGSRVKGTATEDSDYDILVVLSEKIGIKEKRKLAVKLYLELHKKFKYRSFDVIVKAKNEFEGEKTIVNTVSNEAFKDGLIL